MQLCMLKCVQVCLFVCVCVLVNDCLLSQYTADRAVNGSTDDSGHSDGGGERSVI